SDAEIHAALGTASATDNCSTPTVTSSDGAVSSSGCARSQTRTFTATDSCTLSSSTSRTVTWSVATAPVFDNCTGGTTALGCNPATPTCNASITALNKCGPVSVPCSAGNIYVNYA